MVAGLRQHNGEPPVKAVWSAILDEKTWRKVRSILNKQERIATSADGGKHRVNNRRRVYQRHLLTGGIAVCGRCGTSLVVQTGARGRIDRANGHEMPTSALSRGVAAATATAFRRTARHVRRNVDDDAPVSE